MKKIIQIILISIIIGGCNVFHCKSAKSHWVLTKGHYIIESQVSFSKDSIGENSIIRGVIYDEYTGYINPYGYCKPFLNNDSSFARIDSIGNFELMIKSGKQRIGFYQGNSSLVTDTINFERNSITTMRVYMGSNIMYDYDN